MTYRNKLCSILRNALSCEGPHFGVEVGVYKGKTSQKLLREFPSLELLMVDSYVSDIYLEDIDPLATAGANEWKAIEKQAVRNTAAHAARRQMVRLSSIDAAAMVEPQSLDFVFVDADHSFDAVTTDSEVWVEKIRTGGVMIWHDYGSPDDHASSVKRAVDEFSAGAGLHVDEECRLAWMFLEGVADNEEAKTESAVHVEDDGVAEEE